MSCGIELGFLLVDLAIFLIATRATGVALGKAHTAVGESVQKNRYADLIRDAALEASDDVELVSESAADEIHRMLEDGGAGPEFDDAEVLVRAENDDILGLKRDREGIYQVIAKWRPTDADRLQVDTSEVDQKYRQRYAYLKVKKEAERLGYQVAEEEILADQSIRVRVCRWD